MSESIGFNLLHKEVQRWIWMQNWTALRDIQERAIEPILRANCDVIISASTAAGKTEAAFLPACSSYCQMLCMASGSVPFLSYPIHKFNTLDQLS